MQAEVGLLDGADVALPFAPQAGKEERQPVGAPEPALTTGLAVLRSGSANIVAGTMQRPPWGLSLPTLTAGAASQFLQWPLRVLRTLGAWLDALLAGASSFDAEDIAQVIERRSRPSYEERLAVFNAPGRPELHAILSAQQLQPSGPSVTL